ncbi:hypothetical protein PFBG_01639 [Plasmodium falciparum 7G8]|uniref:Uncharacterized protein n=2 Tax=Plasmodium falciparum TaxID=5833 RepID=A0A024V8T2_PLAFA|nr:hypothetical protein PFFVO_01621 [Plasmodium falciparum Vietnam Oak-Knoll (FVO)]EUR74041.1 hypothetical protein PFBG_01639 [Plasmodium falciparum 7G8]
MKYNNFAYIHFYTNKNKKKLIESDNKEQQKIDDNGKFMINKLYHIRYHKILSAIIKKIYFYKSSYCAENK